MTPKTFRHKGNKKILADRESAQEALTYFLNLFFDFCIKKLYIGLKKRKMPNTAARLIIKLNEKSVLGEIKSMTTLAKARELKPSLFL